MRTSLRARDHAQANTQQQELARGRTASCVAKLARSVGPAGNQRRSSTPTEHRCFFNGMFWAAKQHATCLRAVALVRVTTGLLTERLSMSRRSVSFDGSEVLEVAFWKLVLSGLYALTSTAADNNFFGQQEDGSQHGTAYGVRVEPAFANRSSCYFFHSTHPPRKYPTKRCPFRLMLSLAQRACV